MSTDCFISMCAAIFGYFAGRFFNLHILSLPMRYPCLELVTALMSASVFFRFGLGYETLLYCLFGYVLIVLSVTDFRSMTIPDYCHVCILILAGIRICLHPGSLSSLIAGFFILSVPMLILSMLTGGFGGGDIKLCASCGLFLGWQPVLAGALFGGLAAGLYAIAITIHKKTTAKSVIPFGPFLSMGFFLSLFMEPVIQLLLTV